MDYGYDVYVQVDSASKITAINSNAFIVDFAGWVPIESNVQGDKGHHAQNNYLPKSLMTMQGIYQYKLVDGKVAERTAAEIAADIAAIPPPPPSAEERIKALEAELATLKPTVTALSRDIADVKLRVPIAPIKEAKI